MKPQKSSLCVKSFKELKVLIDLGSLPKYSPLESKKNVEKISPDIDEEIFKKAMDGVKPILGKNRIELKLKSKKIQEDSLKRNEEEDILRRLENLVKFGEGFNISETPEYIEGTGYHVHPEIAKRLHEGDFSIQSYIDLHGLTVEEAKEAFDKFLKWATTNAKQGLLIIHGRGLSSPSEPVLKRKVIEWLTKGPWRKWVLAYSSARKCDGGTGATYVLLRLRPVTKRFKIKN